MDSTRNNGKKLIKRADKNEKQVSKEEKVGEQEEEEEEEEEESNNTFIHSFENSALLSCCSNPCNLQSNGSIVTCCIILVDIIVIVTVTILVLVLVLVVSSS